MWCIHRKYSDEITVSVSPLQCEAVQPEAAGLLLMWRIYTRMHIRISVGYTHQPLDDSSQGTLNVTVCKNPCYKN